MIPVHNTEHLPLLAHPHGASVAQEARPVTRAAEQAVQPPLSTQPSPAVVPRDDIFGQPIPSPFDLQVQEGGGEERGIGIGGGK